MFRSYRWHPSRRAKAFLAVELALVGLVLIWVAQAGPDVPEPTFAGAAGGHPMASATPSPRKPLPAPPRAQRARAGVHDRIEGRVLPESDPVAVSIPTIGVRSVLVDLGLDKEGALEVPEDPARAGWFSRGAAPGALGPAVIAGHVTWNGSPAVFHRLGSMRRGDRVSVSRRDGRTAVFTVSRVAQYAKSRFPSRAVYGPIDHAGLRLITCGGTYDAARHRYLDNVVVFASLSAVHASDG
jgi:sortase (surface protein transpeptidase)